MRNFFRSQFNSFLNSDVEREQAIIRCIILAAVVAYLWFAPWLDPQTVSAPRIAALAYLLVSVPLYFHVTARPGKFSARKIAFTILDQVMIAYAVSFGGHTIPIIAFAFWVIIGSAFRYGYPYLFLSAGTASLGLLWNIYYNPLWTGSTTHGWAYLVSILFVVFYTSIFVARARESNRKLSESLVHFSELARVDSLTGLPNRLALVERLTQSIAMTKRLGTYISLLYFDLDGFKTVNDTLGHNHGDALLKEVAKQITSRIRSTDMLARLGGDEFIVILESTRHPQDAIIVAKSILETIHAIKIEGLHHVTETEVTLRTGASIGIATYGPDIQTEAPSVDEFIQRADDAMYIAKQEGKGCYRFWSEDPIQIEPVPSPAHVGISTGRFNLLN